jgi:hypothetical protein
VSGCGGDDSGGTCGEASKCGGDIVGSWKITSTCLTLDAAPMMPSMGCDGATFAADDIAATGGVTYRPDQTYTATVTMTGNMAISLPASCLAQGGITLTCAQVEESLKGQSSPAVGFASSSCKAANGGGCACTVPLTATTTNTEGTYSTSGGVVTQTPNGNAPEDSNYCVQGSTLTLSPADDSTSTTQGSIALTKG